jgi:hypothetical protein
MYVALSAGEPASCVYMSIILHINAEY